MFFFIIFSESPVKKGITFFELVKNMHFHDFMDISVAFSCHFFDKNVYWGFSLMSPDVKLRSPDGSIPEKVNPESKFVYKSILPKPSTP